MRGCYISQRRFKKVFCEKAHLNYLKVFKFNLNTWIFFNVTVFCEYSFLPVKFCGKLE